MDRRFEEFSAAGLAEVFEAHYVFLGKKYIIKKIIEDQRLQKYTKNMKTRNKIEQK